MSEFNFENFRETHNARERNEEGTVYYYPTPYGDRLIDGQVYYLKRRKPPTPYALFIKDRLPQMKMENPRGDVSKMFIDLGREWHYLESEKKCEYYMKYNDEVKKFDLLKKSIPPGVDPRLMVIPRGKYLNENTKRPKYSNDNPNRGSNNDRFLEDDDEEEDYITSKIGKNYADEDGEYIKENEDNKSNERKSNEYDNKLENQAGDSLSESDSYMFRRENYRKIEKKYHSD